MPLGGDTPVKRRAGKRDEDVALRRRSILDAAVLCFGEHGYHGTSLRDVASRAQVSLGGLVHHYPEKAALLEAVLDRRDERRADVYAWDVVDGLTFLRNVLAVAEDDLTDRAQVAMNAVLTAEASAADHPAHEYIARRYRKLRSGIERALQDLAERGLLRDPSVPVGVQASRLLAASDGSLLQWLHEPGAVDHVAALRAHIDSYLTTAL
ncbi:TetR/AcrR family transcriptional regulator [Kineococcus sp. G2]|uniref:TetR/AcrR family transcriptional regulator n=1 Tax=Kineococcus sp. G2 TaxID=3127484 RepID=UPI00301C6F87